MEKLDLAVIGQGRSGKDIHGAFYLSEKNEYFRVKYVVEADERRRAISEERYPGCVVLSDYKELFGKKVDLVVNASFSDDHYPITRDLLEHGFHVLTEKPMAPTLADCDELIRLAKEKGVIWQGFHNTLTAPYFTHAKEVAESGKLGEILQISVCFNGFARRWDWQTMQKHIGGNAYNTGPHPIGFALGLLGFDPQTRVVYSRMANTPLSSGDAEDFCKILLDTPGKPPVDVEIHSTDAYPSRNIKIMGTLGTLVSTPSSYEMTRIVPGENPAMPLQEHFLEDENGAPLYCSEKLIRHEEKGTYPGTAFDIGTEKIYENLYHVLRGEESLLFPPEETRHIIRVIETAHAQNPLERKF